MSLQQALERKLRTGIPSTFMKDLLVFCSKLMFILRHTYPFHFTSSLTISSFVPISVWIHCINFFLHRLTAFVLKSFAQARDFIEIDRKVMADAKRWILGKQTKDGCFPSVGTLHNKAMKVSFYPPLC